MPPEAWISFAGIALLLGLYALWQSLRASFGLAEDDETALTVDGSEARAMLLHEKEAVLGNIRDLEFEHEAGKISESDYQTQNVALRARAKEVLKLLDDDVAPYRKEADALIAERLGQTRKPPYRDGKSKKKSKKSKSAPAKSEAVAEDETRADETRADETRVDESSTGERQTCGACDAVNDADADFCKKCGKGLAAPAADAEADA